MKKYWKRAAGALKDKKSIWLASLAPKSIYRNAHLETAIIRATSHDDTQVDYGNVQRVFAWVRTSPYHLKPLVWAFSHRMGSTRSWVVALKGLVLIHGVLSCKIPAVRSIGRLPFDLSNFSDTHSKPSKSWGYSSFVRAYFAFLDQKSSFMCTHSDSNSNNNGTTTAQGVRKKSSKDTRVVIDDELETLQELQSLLDLLIQVKPQQAEGTTTVLILEAMDSIVIEIFDVYSKICTYIARILSRIYEASQYQASLALKLLQQTNKQAEELSQFFEFCNHLGVLNASEFPKVEQIPEYGIRDLQRIVHGLSDQKSPNDEVQDDSDIRDQKVIAARPSGDTDISSSSTQGRILTTAVTDKWETFEDDLNMNGGIAMDSASYENVSNISYRSTASPALAIAPVLHDASHSYILQPYKQEIPDFISF